MTQADRAGVVGDGVPGGEKHHRWSGQVAEKASDDGLIAGEKKI